MKVLVTGFGPFDKFSSNPAEVVAGYLGDSNPDVETVILPVVYGEATKVLMGALQSIDPDAVISFGLNGTIGCINLEEIALNLRSSDIPDNKGNLISDTPVRKGGPLAYRTSLPLENMQKRLRSEGIPSKRSYSAGVYICNEIFYSEMDWAERNGRTAGFVHIPMATEMIADRSELYRSPHMSMDMLKKAARLILEETIRSVR
ncbi:MAG: pyroglutamyl-peptidase I [Thermoplasmatota archaeon]